MYLNKGMAHKRRKKLPRTGVIIAVSFAAVLCLGTVAFAAPPVTVNDMWEYTLNTPVDITLYAYDPDGDPITDWIIIVPPTSGTLSGEGPEMTYTPFPDSTVNDIFFFMVEAGGEPSNISSVDLIYVLPVNDPPVLNLGDIVFGIRPGDGTVAKSYDIIAFDPNDDILTYEAQNLPAGASLNDVTGELRWDIDYSDIGLYPDVTFIVRDGTYETSQTVDIIVREPDVYYIDAVSGSDETGDGSLNAPWQSLAKARDMAQSGDTVRLFDGNYGAYDETGILRTDWVTYEPVDGHAPELNAVTISNSFATSVYLTFRDIVVRDTQAGDEKMVEISGSRFVRFEGCHFIGTGYEIGRNVNPDDEPYTLAWPDNSKAIYLYDCRNISLQKCQIYGSGSGYPSPTGDGFPYGFMHAIYGEGLCSDITVSDSKIRDCGTAIYMSGTDWRITDNELCYLQDDGIAIGICFNSSITGNYIHHLEAVPQSIVQPIGIWTGGSVESGQIVIAANKIHDIERQGMSLTPDYGLEYLIENNLVYNTNLGAASEEAVFLMAMENVVLRHNTIDGRLYIPAGFRYPFEPSIVSLYSNIIYALDVDTMNTTYMPSVIDYEDYNIVAVWGNDMADHVVGSHSTGRTEQEGSISHEEFYALFFDATDDIATNNGDYHLEYAQADSLAADFGDADSEFSPTDIDGIARDANPDAGCYELRHKGDLDANGFVIVNDVLLAASQAVEHQYSWAADVDGNGMVIINDIILIAGYATHRINSFPSEQ